MIHTTAPVVALFVLNSGEKQIFGSQINLDKETKKYFLYPVIDPENIDERRRQMGLQPISDYLKIWDIDWIAEEYIKILPELEEKVKKQSTNVKI